LCAHVLNYLFDDEPHYLFDDVLMSL